MSDPIDTLKIIVGRRGTKAQVIAESGGTLERQRLAYATDTSELGIWTNGAWVWVPLSSAIPAFATPAIVLGTAAAAGAAATAVRTDATIKAFNNVTPANVAGAAVVGTSAYAAEADHGHGLTYHTSILTDGASNFIFAGGDVIDVVGVPN